MTNIGPPAPTIPKIGGYDATTALVAIYPKVAEKSSIADEPAINIGSAKLKLFVGTGVKDVRPVPPFAIVTGTWSAIVPAVEITPPVRPVPAVIEVTVPPAGFAFASHFAPSQIHVWYV